MYYQPTDTVSPTVDRNSGLSMQLADNQCNWQTGKLDNIQSIQLADSIHNKQTA
jgi:hypothetical protein